MVELTWDPIETEAWIERARSPRAGAILAFLGTTRQFTQGLETEYLVYEAYEPMARRKMEELEAMARQRWELHDLFLVHRLGRVGLAETSVLIVVSSPHRKAAFQAGEWLIDELKQQVPIWKQDHSPNSNARWVH